MPRTNSRDRCAGNYFKVYPHTAWSFDKRLKRHRFDERCIARKVTRSQAMRMLANGTARFEYGEAAAANGQRMCRKTINRMELLPIGLTLNEPEADAKPVRCSPAMLTHAETLANAGAHANPGYCAAVAEKVAIWPLAGTERVRSTTVRPAMSERDFRVAAGVLEMNKAGQKLARAAFVRSAG